MTANAFACFTGIFADLIPGVFNIIVRISKPIIANRNACIGGMVVSVVLQYAFLFNLAKLITFYKTTSFTNFINHDFAANHILIGAAVFLNVAHDFFAIFVTFGRHFVDTFFCISVGIACVTKTQVRCVDLANAVNAGIWTGFVIRSLVAVTEMPGSAIAVVAESGLIAFAIDNGGNAFFGIGVTILGISTWCNGYIAVRAFTNTAFVGSAFDIKRAFAFLTAGDTISITANQTIPACFAF